MGATNSQSRTINYFKLNAKCDEQNVPHFLLSEKIDGKWVKSKKFDTISGSLVKAEIKEKEYEGVKSKVFQIRLDDGNEICQVEMSHNGLSYSIINSICNIKNTLETICINVYRRKPNEKSPKPQAGAFVYLNDNREDKLSWKYSMDIVPKREEQKKADGTPLLIKGAKVYDDTKLREFWEAKFISDIVSLATSKEHSDIINNFSSKPTIQPNTNFNAETDDLPF